MLPADSHVRSVVAEVVETAERGQVFADLSTIAPATIEAVANELADVGVRTLSVAITRGTAAAERGELGLFVGGDDIVLARPSVPRSRRSRTRSSRAATSAQRRR